VLLAILHWLGYGVCHQIPERTIHLAGQALPLCARCSGIYLGVMVGFVFMLTTGRGRSSIMPPVQVLAVMLGFVALFGLDGVNSYLTFFPGAPHLYEPQNWLRLATGTLHGLAISFIVMPVFAFTFWRETDTRPVLHGLKELAALVVAAAAIVLLVETGEDFLLYPVAIVSAVGLLAMFTLLNGAIFLIVSRREGKATRRAELWLPLLVGLAMGLTEIGLLDAVRLWLTATFALPF
jgi:uncharacterized membrane protein